MKKIIPAILTKDPAQLQSKLEKLRGIADWVQIDIMDGKFVDNTSVSLEDVAAAPAAKDFSLEAHLMVEAPKGYFAQCQQAGIKRVIFHAEAGDMENVFFEAGSYNFRMGVALNPQTPIGKILPYVEKLDVVLLMSVNPGFGGQEFMPEVLDKIKELRQTLPDVKIEVDGGLNPDNVNIVSEAGADFLVVGSGLFDSENLQSRFELLQSKIQ